MPITFDCPCGKTLRVPDASVGKRAKCPACNVVLIVPAPEPVFEATIPPLPPEPGAPIEPVEEPEPVALPPLPSRGYAPPQFDDDDDDDKTPYGLAEGESGGKKRGGDLDRDGNPRKKDGLPNFNKGKKKFG